ncbi:MAG: arylsulfatase, partial [Planctomycetota bacterium]
DSVCADDSRPNIVIILADDMGFSDPGCFGGEIDTPNIDRLAAGGVRFTEFYNCARCCPTRASLMTGLYPHQVGLVFNGRSLKKNCVTIAEALRLAGYQTAMVGKWHLTHTTVLSDPALHQRWLDHRYDPGIPFGPIDTYPANRGFQRYYGVIWGVIDYFDPFSLVEGTTPVADVPDDYYFTNAITDKAVGYLKEMADDDRPFFLYFAHCAPHWPLHALPEDIAKYRGKYDEGWDALRKRRFARQVAMGLFDPANTPLPPVMTRGREWDALSPEEKAFQAAKMETHAAMVDRVDQSIGRVIDTLRETGELDNTLIFFLSDNGASPEVPQRPGYDRSSQTRDGKPILYSGFDRPGPETTYTGIGPAWAN